MPFPHQERVVYKSNPLVEVVCQLVFKKPIFKACENNSDAEKLALEVHEVVRKDLPLFNTIKRIEVELKTESQEVINKDMLAFEFATLDKTSRIILDSESVSIVTNKYLGWENFRGALNKFLETGLAPLVKLDSFRRIGLRYKDVIQRRELNLQECTWDELLNPYISKLYDRTNEIAASIVGEQSILDVKLDDENAGMLKIHYGLVTNNKTQEQCFLIDGDFFAEGEIKKDDCWDYLDKYNIKARNFFRWCITERLHSALGPSKN